MSIEEAEAALENLYARWGGKEPMTVLLEDALELRVQLKGSHPLIAEVDLFIEHAERCVSNEPG